MSRQDRAKQFAPFDALKGLRDALKLKEYEHDRGVKGDLSPEKIEQISNTILELKKTDTISITYFCDGYYKTIVGKGKKEIENQIIKISGKTIHFEDIFDIVIVI